MKRFLCFAVSVMLILNLAACSGAQGEMTWQEQYDLGVRYLSEGKYEEAIIAFTAAIEIDPKQAPAYVGRGDAYKGVAQLNMAGVGADAELTENAANAYNNAIADYLKALELGESSAELYKKTAEVYVLLGDTEAAAEILEDGVTATGDKSLSEYLEHELTWQERYDLGVRYLSGGKYEKAITAFTAAIEMEPKQAPAYVGRGDAYKGVAQLSMSGTGADAELTEDAARACNNAIADYLKALELDESAAEVYKKAAEVYVLLGDTEAAVEMLERGVAATGDKSLSEYLEQLNNEIAQKIMQSLLVDIPYYGDPSKCKMTAGQATAFAQVIADGIAGKYNAYGWDGTLKPFFWELENEAVAYSKYKTNRANVILADMDGSGVPYLYVFSSIVDSCSYDVFGWANGEAKHAIGDESYQSRGESALYESDNGTVIRVSSGSNGAASHCGDTYIFSNGAAKEAFSWDVTFDDSSNVLKVTVNGKTTDYPASADYSDTMDAAISASPYKIVDLAKRKLPYAPFSEVESKPATLRQMIDALNACASALSDGKAEPVVVREPSSTQLMAKAMLEKLNALGDPEAYLLDMNADGTPELICYDEEISDSWYGRGYRVYRWDGRKLYEHQFDYFYDSLEFNSIVFNEVINKGYGQEIIKYNNEYALVFYFGRWETENYYVYFLDHTDTIYEAWDALSGVSFAWEYNGEEITEQRYNQLLTEYGLEEVNWESQMFHNFPTRTNLPNAKTKLNKLLMG